MPSLPNTLHPLTTTSALEGRDTPDTILEGQPRILIQTSTVLAIFFGFAAIMIIVTSACIIFHHRRRHEPSGSSEPMSKWGRTPADADRQSDSIGSRRNETQQNFEQVPMLQPMAFLQGREGPKEFVVGGGKRRRSSALPRLIADGMGGIWPRRHSIWTLNSDYAAGEDGEEQEGTLSSRASKRSHRSRRSSKATISRKNGSLASTVQMDRTIVKKPSVTSEPSPSLSSSPSAFSAPRISRNTSASTNGPPSSYKKSRLRHQQGESFLEDDIHEDELQTSYVGSVSSAASSSVPRTVDLAAFPVPPLPTLNTRNHANNH